MEHPSKIKTIEKITPDVLQIVLEKSPGLTYVPGQAADISLVKSGWEHEKRPFTFTSIPSDNHLEFTIKTYPERKGLTNELLSLKVGDIIIIHDVFGEIAYRGEGVFIAGGAGITPFISIFRDLKFRGEIGNNKLIYANKNREDIILKDELGDILNNNFINVLSKEQTKDYLFGYITEEIIKQNISRSGNPFYLCGPPPMMEAIEKQLAHLGIENSLIIKEGF